MNRSDFEKSDFCYRNSKKAADKLLSDGLFWLGHIYFWSLGSNKNSLVHFQKSAQLNHPAGLFWNGYMIANGFGTKKDISLAISNFEKSLLISDSYWITVHLECLNITHQEKTDILNIQKLSSEKDLFESFFFEPWAY